MTDRTFAEKGRPAACREHGRGTHGRLGSFCGDRFGISSRRKYRLHRQKDIEQGFLSGFRPPGPFAGSVGFTVSPNGFERRGRSGTGFPEFMEEGTDERPGGAAALL